MSAHGEQIPTGKKPSYMWYIGYGSMQEEENQHAIVLSASTVYPCCVDGVRVGALVMQAR